jgi:pilus assembly protein CpaF
MTTLTIYHEGEQPATIDLAEGDYVIGRGERCRVRLAHPAVSERHAILSVRADAAWIEDLDSSNGTYLNAIPVGRRTRVNAPITIGPYLLVVGQVEDEKELPVLSSQCPVDNGQSSNQPTAEPLNQPAQLETANRELQSSAVQAATPPKPAAPPPDPMAEQRRSIKQQIHREVVERLDLKRLSASRISGEELRERAMQTILQIVHEVEGRLPAGIEPNALAREIYNEALLLGPLEDLLADDTVTEVMVNGPDRIYVERGGRLQLTGTTFMDEASVMAIIERIVSPLGRRIDESQPYVDARLADGSRVNAIIHPLSLVGPCITIRKFSKKPLYDHDLIRFGTLTPEMARFLQVCVLMRKNIIVSGGTGSGKTTLLNVIGNYLPPDERILTIEDAAELRLQQPHLVRL